MQKPQWNRIKDFVQRKELSLAMGLHLGAIFLCGLIYILLPEDVHLRWGLTYIPIWAALLSPIALMIAARKSKRKLVIRLYSALIGIGLLATCHFPSSHRRRHFSPFDLLLQRR